MHSKEKLPELSTQLGRELRRAYTLVCLPWREVCACVVFCPSHHHPGYSQPYPSTRGTIRSSLRDALSSRDLIPRGRVSPAGISHPPSPSSVLPSKSPGLDRLAIPPDSGSSSVVSALNFDLFSQASTSCPSVPLDRHVHSGSRQTRTPTPPSPTSLRPSARHLFLVRPQESDSRLGF